MQLKTHFCPTRPGLHFPLIWPLAGRLRDRQVVAFSFALSLPSAGLAVVRSICLPVTDQVMHQMCCHGHAVSYVCQGRNVTDFPHSFFQTNQLLTDRHQCLFQSLVSILSPGSCRRSSQSLIQHPFPSYRFPICCPSPSGAWIQFPGPCLFLVQH